MGLIINQTYAKIGIDRVPSKLEIQTQNAQLDQKQNPLKLDIRTEMPQLQIDQYEAFASAGLKNYRDLTKEAADRGYQQVMEYIGKTAADGDTLADIQNGGGAIIDICKRDSYTEHEFGYDTIPKVGPQFSLKPGTITVTPQWTGNEAHNGVEGEYTPGKVNLNFTPTQISIYMRQYASISFDYQESSVDTRI